MYYLESDHIAPKRIIDRIDKVTNSLMENGLYKFYASKAEFSLKLLMRRNDINLGLYGDNHDDDDDFHPLTMQQMLRVMFILLSLQGIAILIFIGEILIFKWRERRLRKHTALNLLHRINVKNLVISICFECFSLYFYCVQGESYQFCH